MKALKKILWLLLISYSQQSFAQTINLGAIEDTKHIVNLGVGWDYGLTYNCGYAYQLKTKLPVILNSNFSIPSGKKMVDDLKFKLGGQIVVVDHLNFKGSISLSGIYRTYKNPLVELKNIGSEIKTTIGYYKMKWFIAGELGFDKALVTHFKHTESFKTHIYQNVIDGWYRPSTGGHFLYGIQTGYSFKKLDFTMSIGKVSNQDFRSTPLIPYYMTLGFSYKINP